MGARRDLSTVVMRGTSRALTNWQPRCDEGREGGWAGGRAIGPRVVVLVGVQHL